MFGGLLKVLRKGRCQVCGLVTKDLLPEIPRKDGTSVDICVSCVAECLDYVVNAMKATVSKPSRSTQETGG